MCERRRATPGMREIDERELTLRDGWYMLTRPRADKSLFKRVKKYILVSRRAFPEETKE